MAEIPGHGNIHITKGLRRAFYLPYYVTNCMFLDKKMSSTLIQGFPMFDMARQLESCRLLDDDAPVDDLLDLSPLTTPESSPDTFFAELPPDDVGGNEGTPSAGPISRMQRQTKRNKLQSKNNRKKRARVESGQLMDGPPARAKAEEKHSAAAILEHTATDIADRPASKGAYTALNKPVAGVKVVSLEELRDRRGFKVIEWDGK
jgi:hypothetical protein